MPAVCRQVNSKEDSVLMEKGKDGSEMTIEEMRVLLAQSLKPKRYEHSIRVYETALQMAEHYKADRDKVALAALLHDCGRQVPVKESTTKARSLGIPVDAVEEAQPVLLHAKLGVYFAVHKYGVEDPEILDAIRFHSTGTVDMGKTAKIIFLADLIEPGRDFEGVEELKKVSFEDLDKAMFLSYDNTIRYLLDDKALIHPDAIAGYNQLAAAFRQEKKSKK